MHPRTLFIVLAVILGGAVAVRVIAMNYNWWPMSRESVLKRARALSVSYWDQGQHKTQHFSDPAEVAEILACLKVRNEDESKYYHVFGRKDSVQPFVAFHFRNGEALEYTLDSVSELGDLRVDRAFAEKLGQIAARREGHPINLFAVPEESVKK